MFITLDVEKCREFHRQRFRVLVGVTEFFQRRMVEGQTIVGRAEAKEAWSAALEDASECALELRRWGFVGRAR